jgi:small subunit ribosomal protein S6e
MVGFKLTISDTKTGRTVQREVKDKDAQFFIGKKIGETIKGETINLTGYEFEITGGSDYCGFPMRRDIPGSVRKRILAVSGVGIKRKRKGQKQRKTVCGNTIHTRISQINLKVLKEGKEKLFGGVKDGAKSEEGKKEKKEQQQEKIVKEKVKDEIKEEDKKGTKEVKGEEKENTEKEMIKEGVKKEEKKDGQEEPKEEKKETN